MVLRHGGHIAEIYAQRSAGYLLATGIRGEMHRLHQGVTGHHQLSICTGINQSAVVTDTQRHSPLTGEVLEVGRDKLKFAGLIAPWRGQVGALSGLYQLI